MNRKYRQRAALARDTIWWQRSQYSFLQDLETSANSYYVLERVGRFELTQHSSKSEVAKLDLPLSGQQDVFGFDIAVQTALLVAICDAQQCLISDLSSQMIGTSWNETGDNKHARVVEVKAHPADSAQARAELYARRTQKPNAVVAFA